MSKIEKRVAETFKATLLNNEKTAELAELIQEELQAADGPNAERLANIFRGSNEVTNI